VLTQAANDPQPAPPDPSSPAVATCAACRHLLPRGTCARPIEAGLIPATEGYGLAWPPVGHGAGCLAFEAQQVPPAAQERAYKLLAAAADAAHAQPWTEAQIRLYNARTVRCRGQGFTAADADDLAERLHLRDATGDTRVACTECRRYERGRCAQHRAAGLQADAVGRDLAVLPQRCPAHEPAFNS